jgi:hypothetical protein
MKSRFTYFTLICLFISASAASLSAQRTDVKKDIAFIVRKPDLVKNIAARFHLTTKTLTKLNPPIHKRQRMYVGKKLIIPVWLKRKDNHSSASDFNLGDYQLDTDSLDIYVTEDFICMAEIEADTVRRIAIDKEIRKIDRRIMAVNILLDSIEHDGRLNLSNKEIKKIPMDRARRIGYFSQGQEIDSLLTQRKRISDEKTKIDLAIADYEYLVDNAPYMAAQQHAENNELRTIQIKEWGDDPNKVNITPGGEIK